MRSGTWAPRCPSCVWQFPQFIDTTESCSNVAYLGGGGEGIGGGGEGSGGLGGVGGGGEGAHTQFWALQLQWARTVGSEHRDVRSSSKSSSLSIIKIESIN